MPRGRKPGSTNKISKQSPLVPNLKKAPRVSKLPKYILTPSAPAGFKPAPLPATEPKPESWWSEHAAEADIKTLLTQMGADSIRIFKGEDTEPGYHGQGMAVCFWRLSRLQYMACSVFQVTAENLRQIYLSIKTMHTIESQGIIYGFSNLPMGAVALPDDFPTSSKPPLLPPPKPVV